jgi:hypothetical protein
MTDPNTAPEGVDPAADEEVVPDYSRVGFKALRALCKDRGLPADGTVVELIEKLKAYDTQHGRDVDLSAAENLPDDEEEVDLLADDEDAPAAPAAPKGSDGGGEAASAPPPPGYPHQLPEGGTMTSAAPAVVVYTSPDQSKGLPSSTLRGGRANMTAREGLVRVGEGHGAAEVRAFRHEIPIGPRDVNDADHFAYIAEAHAAAHAAGYQTKGGTTVGERVGYGRDADGRRTVIYQVPLRRQS